MPYVLFYTYGANHAVGAHVLGIVYESRPAVCTVIRITALIYRTVFTSLDGVVDCEHTCREGSVTCSCQLSHGVLVRIIIRFLICKLHIRVVLQYCIVFRLQVERHRTVHVDILHRFVERLHDIEVAPVGCRTICIDSEWCHVERAVVQIHTACKRAACAWRHDGLTFHCRYIAAFCKHIIAYSFHSRRDGNLRQCLAASEHIIIDDCHRLRYRYLAETRTIPESIRAYCSERFRQCHLLQLFATREYIPCKNRHSIRDGHFGYGCPAEGIVAYIVQAFTQY